MTVNATAGATLHIGGVLAQKAADFTAADFTSQTWVEIGEIESLGSVGDTSEAVSFTSLKRARTRTLKGPRSAGTMEVVCGIDAGDPGQVAAIAAEKTSYDYAFKVTFSDAPPGGDPSQRLYIAKVMSQSEQYDQANSVMKLSLSLGVNSNIVRVAAEA